jgi:hypothetical protein
LKNKRLNHGARNTMVEPNPQQGTDMPKATKTTTPKSSPKLAKDDVKRSAPIDAIRAGIADTRPSFSETICDLSTGMDLLIERLGYAFDVTSNLDHAPGEDGWYAMNAINETRWVTQRLREDIRAVRREFDQDLSARGKVKFAQAAE